MKTETVETNQKDTHEETNYEYDPDFIEEVEGSPTYRVGDTFNFLYIEEISGVVDEWQYGLLKGVYHQTYPLTHKQADKINEALEDALNGMRRANRRKRVN